MLRSREILLLLLSLPACDTQKRGVAGATCRASSDCVDELQCIRATCVELGASGAPTQEPATSVPAAPASITPAPVAVAQPAIPPVAPAVAPVATPPPSEPARDEAPARIPWLSRTDASDGVKESDRGGGIENLPPPPSGGRPESGKPPVSPPAPPGPATTDAPTSPSAPPIDASDPFASSEGWEAALANASDPWATEVLKALQSFRIGTFGAESKEWQFVFQLSACPDGKFQVKRKRSTGDSMLDSRIENMLASLQVPVSKPIRARMGGNCRKIPRDFTMKSRGGVGVVK